MADASQINVLCFCKPDKISAIFSQFDDNKAQIVRSIGFGGLLRLPNLGISRHLCLYLYQRLNLGRMSLELEGRVQLKMRSYDVNAVLGIPCLGSQVSFSKLPDPEIADAFRSKLFPDNACSAPNMDYLEYILTKDYGPSITHYETEAFKIATVMVAMCYLLAPVDNYGLPLQLIPNFVPIVSPENMNWGEYVLYHLGQAAAYAKRQLESGSRDVSILGCSVFLQVYYLDNLNFGPCTPYHSLLPRVAAYSVDVIAVMIIEDLIHVNDAKKFLLFGKCQVRPAHDVCYSRGWDNNMMMCTETLDLSLDDFTSAVEILSNGMEFIHKFAMELDHLDLSNHYALVKGVEAYKNSYLEFRSKIGFSFHNLSTRAADLLKKRMISMYHQRIRQVDRCAYNKQISSGSSNIPVMKRTKFTDSNIQAGTSTLDSPPILIGHPIHKEFTAVSNTMNFAEQNLQPGVSILQGIEQLLGPNVHIGEPSKAVISGPGHFQYELHDGIKRKVVTSHSDFQKPIFELNVNGEEVTWADKERWYNCMINKSMNDGVLDRLWVVIHAPKAINMSGHDVVRNLSVNAVFDVSMVDTIMVVLDYLDAKIYHKLNLKKRWRHFLPASFAEVVKQNCDYLKEPFIIESFIGHHITYNVADCQRIIIPVRADDGTWSCYVWDFKFKTISILDPIHKSSNKVHMARIHQDTVNKLHEALFACIHSFFCGWDLEDIEWKHVYVNDIGHRSKPNNSGVYTAHLARAFFYGKCALQFKDPYEARLPCYRGELLYQILSCPFNHGFRPFPIC